VLLRDQSPGLQVVIGCCSNCGAEIDSNARRCNHCGETVPDAISQEASLPNVLPPGDGTGKGVWPPSPSGQPQIRVAPVKLLTGSPVIDFLVGYLPVLLLCVVWFTGFAVGAYLVSNWGIYKNLNRGAKYAMMTAVAVILGAFAACFFNMNRL